MFRLTAGSEHDAAVNDSLDRTRISPLLDETDTTQEVDVETPFTVTPLTRDNDDAEQPINLSQTYHQTSYRRRPSSFEVTTTATTAEQKPTKATVDYINNIKIFLTNIVIIHHCFDAGQGFTIIDMVSPTSQSSWGYLLLRLFTGLNQSYFMNLFFFFSGYFVPKSLDKKGIHEFLFDRAKRLLIPFVVYNFFLGSFVEYGFRSLFFPNFDFPSGTYNWGPTWFLNQLFFFSIIYAFAFGERWSPTMIKCPSLLGFFIIGLVIGTFTGILLLFTDPGGNFLAVPGFWSNYPSYIPFFFAGAIAQRNDWMKNIKNMSRIVIYLWALLSAALYCALNIIFSGDDNPIPSWVGLLLGQGIIWKGVLCMGLSLAVTVFFMDYGNKKYKYLTPFFSKAMYTAYIIQYAFPMIIGGWSVVRIFDATGNIEYVDGAPFISKIT